MVAASLTEQLTRQAHGKLETAQTFESAEMLETLLDTDEVPQLRLWAVVRRELKMTEGKLVPQAGHAFLDCGLSADPKVLYQRTSKAKNFAMG